MVCESFTGRHVYELIIPEGEEKYQAFGLHDELSYHQWKHLNMISAFVLLERNTLPCWWHRRYKWFDYSTCGTVWLFNNFRSALHLPPPPPPPQTTPTPSHTPRPPTLSPHPHPRAPPPPPPTPLHHPHPPTPIPHPQSPGTRLNRQSKYPNPWIGKCYIPVLQRLEHSACDWGSWVRVPGPCITTAT